MRIKVPNIKLGHKKFLSLFFLMLGLIFVSGILSPVIIQHKENNWEKEQRNLTTGVESSIVSIFYKKQTRLISTKNNIQREILKLISKKNISSGTLIEKVNEKRFAGYSIEIFNDSEQLIAWTSKLAIAPESFFPLTFKPGEVHFCRSGLITYLSIIDTINAGKNPLYLSVSSPVEKHNEIENNSDDNLNLSQKLSKIFSTLVEIEYSPVARKTNDGRKYSVEIQNNLSNKIAVVTFTKPSREVNLSDTKDFFTDIQSIFAVLSFIFLVLAYKEKFNLIRSRVIKLVFIFILLTAFRIILFLLDFPLKFLEGPLTDASFFASSFGFGIVKSPLEFFITISLFFFLCLIIFNYARDYSKTQQPKRERNYFIFFVLSLFSAIIFLIMLRALGASVRSIVFDSSLRYFKEPGLLPAFPAGVMQMNLLILGLASVLLSVSIVLILFSFIPEKEKYFTSKFVLVVLFLFEIMGIIYDLLQREPQGTPLIRSIFIVLIFILAYKVFREEKRIIYNYIYFALVSSIITISLLSYYNSELEKESLKYTALELTRPNDDWLEFLVREALFNATKSQDTFESLKEQQTNFETAAFIIWSQSSLRRESMNSSITFLDKQKHILGGFGLDISPQYRINPQLLDYQGEEPLILNNYRPGALHGKIISGITPIKEENVTLGYVVATILYNPEKYRINNFPLFLLSDNNPINTTVNFEKLKIFDFSNGKLTNVFGDIIPADWHVENIIKARFNENNEAWINLNINDENYITYVLKVNENKGDRILAISLKEKNLSWSLYNFFKVFFIHSIFIMFFLLTVIFQQIQKIKYFRYTFRAQLLGAFLFISLLPMLFLAFYNRNLTDEKNLDLIVYKLRQASLNIQNYISEHLNENPQADLRALFASAAKDLNIDYAVYSSQKLIYSSRDEYYRAGLIPTVINPVVFDKMSNQGYKEYIVPEDVENFVFNSFYNKTNFEGKEYVLKVNDAFNRILLPITGEEVDIFLFASYFFAIILVVILSTLMANKISSPIRSLTKATASVAGGDLNFEVEYNQEGELKDLITAFNSMIKELKRSQQELSELERENAWKEMARQVAHEIKNPLTPMKLAVQQLTIAYKDKSPKFDFIFDKVSKTIIGQIDTLNNIASEFSRFARMPNLKMEKINISSTLEETCDLFVEENIRIVIDPPGTAYFTESDRDQLKRTFINLIRNSIQAGAGEIRFEFSSFDRFVNLMVTDNGRGIPEEYIARIFEPNFTTKEKGMGLGLKMARKFMESINGNISIKESTAKGTVIQLRFVEVA